MTIAVLRSLHEIIGNAIDDIERTYSESSDSTPSSKCQTPVPSFLPSEGLVEGQTSQAYASPPPSPCTSNSWNSPPSTSINVDGKEPAYSIDFPSLDTPCDPGSLSEALTTHPVVLGAIGRIVAAAGQLSATVQTPFLTLCEAIMGYHLPSCMRLLEASHVVEILREAGPAGLDVHAISEKNGVAPSKLAHILRLLATHHLLQEVSPNVFTLNRLSSLIDSGKTFAQIKQFEREGQPEMKYRDTNGISAFVGLCTDEIQKSAAYMTDTYYLSPSEKTREGADPVRAPFCVAFDTVKTGTGFFGWLEGETFKDTTHRSYSEDESIKPGRGAVFSTSLLETSSQNPRHGQNRSKNTNTHMRQKSTTTANAAVAKSPTPTSPDSDSAGTVKEAGVVANLNKYRLERFGKAMSGTNGWEVPGAVLNGFDWASLPRGSVVVDVGGGIGSTTMILATAFASTDEDAPGLMFIVQDRAVVCEMGEKAWKAKRPELLATTVEFQVHDFFTPQPVKDAAVFLLRVVLHDWPDDFARKILLRLREAASSETKLLIADFVLPLACPDDTSSDGVLEGVVGAESVLAPAPLLPNLGKASSNVYWMDLTMQVMFNAQERTLRELVTLASSAGWKIIKVTKTPGSLFGYLVAVPIDIPQHLNDNGPAGEALPPNIGSEDKLEEPGIMYRRSRYKEEIDVHRTSSRCGTPTFGSHMKLSSVEETVSRFGSSTMRSKTVNRFSPSTTISKTITALKPALSLSSSLLNKKKKPSPLTLPPLQPSPTTSHSPRWLSSAPTSPWNEQFKTHSPPPSSPKTMIRQKSLANLRPHAQYATIGPPPPLPVLKQQPPSPLSPRSGYSSLNRRASQAQLSPHITAHLPSPLSPLTSLIPVRTSTTIEPSSPKRVPCSYRAVAVTPTDVVSRAPARVITRRASTAHLPQPSIRKRSGTMISGRNTDSFGNLSDAGTVLRFDKDVRTAYSPQRSSPSNQAQFSVLNGVSFLAAAARIESEHP